MILNKQKIKKLLFQIPDKSHVGIIIPKGRIPQVPEVFHIFHFLRLKISRQDDMDNQNVPCCCCYVSINQMDV